MKLKKSVLIVDLDNTLFDWFSIWYHSFEALLSKVEEISGINRAKLIEEIKPIHQKHGTAEYAFVLGELPSLQALYGDRSAINAALDDAIHAFRSARKKHMNLYPGVLETLMMLKDLGVKIVGYTESREYYTVYRMKRLSLDGVIDVLYSPRDHAVPIEEEERTLMALEMTQHGFVPEGEIKPNPKVLLTIIQFVGATPELCVYVGDSEMKDIEMAKAANVTDVLAKYGAAHFEENPEGYNLLRAVTHWTDEDVLREKKIKEEASGLPPTHSIDAFPEILEIFEFQPFEEHK